jgi:hypothetical protein
MKSCVISYFLYIACFVLVIFQDEMGFDFSDRKSRYDWESIRLALNTFKDIHGHMNVPRKYDLPRDDPRWPEQTWGIKLGNVGSVIRIRGCYKSHHDELREMGFVFERKWVKGQSKAGHKEKSGGRSKSRGGEEENESGNEHGGEKSVSLHGAGNRDGMGECAKEADNEEVAEMDEGKGGESGGKGKGTGKSKKTKRTKIV